MPQASKILHSQKKWKEKAIKLSEELRESRKARKRYKNKIEELKKKLKEEGSKKKSL